MRFSLILSLLIFSNLLGFGQSHQTHLRPGDQAPVFEASDAEGNWIKSSDLLAQGPIVLIFYRGEWCPVCKRHLSNFQDSLSFILDKGAQVVAVTPEQPQYMEKMAKATEASFSLLHDKGYSIMKAYGVDFKVEEANVPRYFGFTLNHTRSHNGNEDDQLPVPATFIIRQDGTISWLHYDFDYRNRASVREILGHL